jgi:hypothetical protein
MTRILKLNPETVVPPRAPVLAHQGITAGRSVSDAVEATWREACALYPELAKPVGVLREITREEFARVYRGEGRNDERTPVAEISARADRLALFAVTLGEGICQEISARFESHDLAVGCMLDSVASIAADDLAEHVGRQYREGLDSAGQVDAYARALCYSPGYCGWHISGQLKLFGYLRPQEIGITLRQSFLMDPLKSVSGVVLVGPREIHEFDMDYTFCAQCTTRSCRARINALAGS